MATSLLHKRAAHLAAVCTLCLLGALAVVWTSPRVSSAARAWMSAPPVELRSAALPADLPVQSAAVAKGSVAGAASEPPLVGDGSRAVTMDAGMRFTMAGVTCAPPHATGPVVLELRTSEDGSAWSRWYEVELERVAEEGGREQAFTEPIWTGSGRYLQVAARSAGEGAAPARLRDVRVVAINSTEDADTASALVGVVRRAAATIAGIEFAPPASAMTAKPKIVTRAGWGANESWRSGSPDYAPVKVAFVHHTASGNGYSAAQGPAVVRAIYAYHTKSLHWSDIGYNFLIDRYGVIYEGRFGGVTRGVIGAQVLGFNTGSTGISLIGTFADSSPPSRALTSLERLLEWKLDVHHVDPVGKGTLVCGYGQKFATGQRVSVPAIAGHRNANFTDCPGGRLYAQLPNVRKVVDRTGQPKIYGFVTSQPAISPNGDGVRDKVEIGFIVSQQASWTLEIRDEAGSLVKHSSGEGTAVDLTWGGHDDDGDLLPDGVYTLKAGATSAAGVARAATADVRLDTVPPDVESPGVAPDPFSPNGDGQHDTTALSYTPAEAVGVRLSVVDANGEVLRRVTSWKSASASAHKVKWDGKVGAGTTQTPAPEGTATLLLEARDDARNITSLSRKVVVDRTLKLTGVSKRTLSPNGDGVRDDVTLTFKLTRAADVVATVVRSGSTLRTYELNRLAAGAQSLTWDGKLAGGGNATSGPYSIKVTADGALGVTSVAQKLTVDLTAPRITAPLTVRVAYRKTARISYTVKDAFSPTVKVGAVVTNAAGKVVSTLSLGWVKQGSAHTCPWRPNRRGTYTVTFRAMDQGGNKLATRVATTVKVR
jgi:flagellar hook assembly protein FlgD